MDSISIEVFNEKIDNEKVRQGVETYTGANDVYGSSKPNIHKETKKNELKVFLRKYHDFSQAQKIYLELTQ